MGGAERQVRERMLTFEPIKHEYKLDGRILPSVTTVLKGTGMIDFSMIPQNVLQAAAHRGTAVHQALHYWDDGELDESTLDPVIVPYVDAGKRFYSESRFEVAHVEQRVFDAVHGYAGTLDRTGTFPDGSMAVVDWKTGILMPGHALQLAAYAACLEHPRRYRRIAVQLKDDGTYRINEYAMKDFETDYRMFLSALACWQWQIQNATGRAA
jgi:hypothetical protein